MSYYPIFATKTQLDQGGSLATQFTRGTHARTVVSESRVVADTVTRE